MLLSPPIALQTRAENEELREDLSEVTAHHNSVLEENQRLRAKLENLEQVIKVRLGSGAPHVIFILHSYFTVREINCALIYIFFSPNSICERSPSEGSSWNWNMSRHWLSLSSNRMKSNGYTG